MTNFDFLDADCNFARFAGIAKVAERTLAIDAATCIMNCRRAMETAVKWMYSVDDELALPYQENLVTLINDEKFRSLVGKETFARMDFIRKVGNNVAHGGRKISVDIAKLCLENLYYFLDQVAHYYSGKCPEHKFDKSLLDKKENGDGIKLQDDAAQDVDIKALIEENKALKVQLSQHRLEQKQSYTPKPLELSEYETRKAYIDFMLLDAGWKYKEDWQNEVELVGMPTGSGVGRADYVLYADDRKPLAIIEAKKTCKDVASGRQQAKLYADAMLEKYGRRPVVFFTNGFETRIDDGVYPERSVAGFYSKRDLEKFFNLQRNRTSLKNVCVDEIIAGRYYQKAAIKAVCSDFGVKNRRKSLLVMATGSGKTRTVIELSNILLQNGWVKNILFLADRNALVTQAKRSFTNLLPTISTSNLCESERDFNARCVFSTYQSMMNIIDEVRDDKGKVFSVGHFDLVIVDEAHRSIYNKYQDIFNYFDAFLIGLTATPKDEVDRNTYEVFELENGVPTYVYDLQQAVNDGYLVPFTPIVTKLKFMEEGIAYDDLPEDEKREYEDTFTSMDGSVPKAIESNALNEWIFNKDTIRKALEILFEYGLKIDYGTRIGKTIIFARNHNHAEKILEAFNHLYPELSGFAKVIDNQINYAQSIIDEFSISNKLPQIAISVDMLDTGIDIPEILNLVFFKKVMSRAKFHQMIGRGTRLCPSLLDGADKKEFYIFDLCNNFEFFRVSKGKETSVTPSLSASLFYLKFCLAFKLQDIAYQTSGLQAFRKSLVSDMTKAVNELNRESFAVRQHMKCVDLYGKEENYNALTFEDTINVKSELAPLILPQDYDVRAERFDALLYGIELALVSGKKFNRHKVDLIKKCRLVAGIANIPEIMVQKELLEKIISTSFLDNADVSDFENIRENIRNLIKYVPCDERSKYDTNFTDDILSVEWAEAELKGDEFKNYRAKAEFYIREHQDNPAIAKLKGNEPLSKDDIDSLERILWSEVGSREDYRGEFGDKPLGEFVREVVGLDMKAAKSAFAEYLNSAELDEKQIYFVNQIVEYIVHNGIMKDLSVLQEPPFTKYGSVVEVFADLTLWSKIRKTIDGINARATAI